MVSKLVQGPGPVFVNNQRHGGESFVKVRKLGAIKGNLVAPAHMMELKTRLDASHAKKFKLIPQP